MKIEYTNTMEDLVAFSEFHHAHSRTARRSLRQYQWGGAVAIFVLTMLLFGALARMTDMPRTLLFLIPFLYASLFAATAPRNYRRAIRKNLINMYSEGSNRRFLCRHEMEVVPDGLIERTPYSQTKIAWGAIDRIEATSDHTFIYIGAAMAYVIPNKKITGGDLASFLTAFQQNFTPDLTLQTPLPLVAPAPVITPPVTPKPTMTETVTVVPGKSRWYAE